MVGTAASGLPLPTNGVAESPATTLGGAIGGGDRATDRAASRAQLVAAAVSHGERLHQGLARVALQGTNRAGHRHQGHRQHDGQRQQPLQVRLVLRGESGRAADLSCQGHVTDELVRSLSRVLPQQCGAVRPALRPQLSQAVYPHVATDGQPSLSDMSLAGLQAQPPTPQITPAVDLQQRSAVRPALWPQLSQTNRQSSADMSLVCEQTQPL